MRRSIFLSLFLVLAIIGYVNAQPPAIGPGANSGQAGEISVFTIKVLVEAKTRDIVQQVNTQLENDGESARVSMSEIKPFKPLRTDTRYFDRPNSTYVRTPVFVKLNVNFPALGTLRTIHIPIDVEVSCNGWQNGTGTIGIRAVPGPPSIEGGSIFEDIIQVRGFIDAKVRNNMPTLLPSSAPPLLADPRCRNIGVTDFGTATVNDDAIHFDRPARGIIGTSGVLARPSVEVTFDRLKRLNARDLNNGVLYSEVEQIALNAFANYEQRQKIVSMREGDDIALNLQPVRLISSQYDKLVVIGNIEQPPNNPKDSAFRASLRAQNYEPGTHVLRIPKFYTRPPDRFNPHPTFVRVDAYELTYTVRSIGSPVISVGVMR